MTGAELVISDLKIGYRAKASTMSVLKGVDLRVAPGEVAGLVGESGSGKSTLAYAVMNYLARNAVVENGSIAIDGEDILSVSPERLRELRRGLVSMVYQDPMASLNPIMSVGDQLLENIRLSQKGSAADHLKRAHELLEQVNLPNPRAMMQRFPHEISGGEKQRILIAMAFSMRPRLMICDEPTTALDPTTAAQVLDLLRSLKDQTGVSVLYISHDLATVSEIADRVAVIQHGEIVEQGETEVLLRSPEHPYTRNLLGSQVNSGQQPIRRRVLAYGQAPEAEWQQGERLFAREDTPLLRLESVDVRYGKPRLFDRMRSIDRTFRAAKAIDLAIASGETVGLVGESGCGKSSLAKAIAGLVEFDGSLSYRGSTFRSMRALSANYRKDIQIVFQHPDAALNPKRTIGQILGRPAAVRDDIRGAKLTARVAELLRMVRLPEHYASRHPHELSGGEKQRVCIARALAGRPSLMICDEITSGLDVSVQGAILNLLADLQDEHGLSYLFISHDLNVVQHIADRIVVMYLGRIVEVRGTVSRAAPYHPYTEALFSAVPSLDPGLETRRVRLEGNRPDPRDPPPGCSLNQRCPRRLGEICVKERPPLREIGDGQLVACHIPTSELEAVPPLWAPAESLKEET